jgi:hypothetical protein
MALDILFEQIPKSVAYHRTPLDDAHNALGPWREAIRRFVPPDEEEDLWGELISAAEEGDDAENRRVASSPESVRELLAANRRSLELLHEGIARGRLQFPRFEYPGRPDEDTDLVVHLGEVAWLPFVCSRLLAEDHDMAGAAREMIALLRMGELICNGDGQLLHYLIGAWIRKAAAGGIRRLAARKNVPPEVLADLFEAVERGMESPDGLARSLRADFCSITLPQLDRMPEGEEIQAFADRLMDLGHTGEPRPGLLRVANPDSRENDLDRSLQEAISLLEGHPRPFDRLATARLMGQRLAQWLDVLEQQPAASNRGFASHLRRLLRLSRRFPFVHSRRGESDSGAGEPGSHDDWAEFRALLETDLSAARERLKELDNPVGLILAERLMPADVSPFLLEHRAALEETRKLLLKRTGRTKRG